MKRLPPSGKPKNRRHPPGIISRSTYHLGTTQQHHDPTTPTNPPPTTQPHLPGAELRGIAYADGTVASEILLQLAENGCLLSKVASTLRPPLLQRLPLPDLAPWQGWDWLRVA